MSDLCYTFTSSDYLKGKVLNYLASFQQSSQPSTGMISLPPGPTNDPALDSRTISTSSNLQPSLQSELPPLEPESLSSDREFALHGSNALKSSVSHVSLGSASLRVALALNSTSDERPAPLALSGSTAESVALALESPRSPNLELSQVSLRNLPQSATPSIDNALADAPVSAPSMDCDATSSRFSIPTSVAVRTIASDGGSSTSMVHIVDPGIGSLSNFTTSSLQPPAVNTWGGSASDFVVKANLRASSAPGGKSSDHHSLAIRESALPAALLAQDAKAPRALSTTNAERVENEALLERLHESGYVPSAAAAAALSVPIRDIIKSSLSEGGSRLALMEELSTHRPRRSMGWTAPVDAVPVRGQSDLPFSVDLSPAYRHSGDNETASTSFAILSHPPPRSMTANQGSEDGSNMADPAFEGGLEGLAYPASSSGPVLYDANQGVKSLAMAPWQYLQAEPKPPTATFSSWIPSSTIVKDQSIEVPSRSSLNPYPDSRQQRTPLSGKKSNSCMTMVVLHWGPWLILLICASDRSKVSLDKLTDEPVVSGPETLKSSHSYLEVKPCMYPIDMLWMILI